MRVLVQNTLTNRQYIAFDGPGGFLIGREEPCDVRLDSRFVSPIHAKVERVEMGWEVEVLPGANPIEIDGLECSSGQRQLIKGAGSSLRVMEFLLQLSESGESEKTSKRRDVNSMFTDVQNQMHASVLHRLELRLGAFGEGDISHERIEKLIKICDELLTSEFRSQIFRTELFDHIVKLSLRSRLTDWVVSKLTRDEPQSAWSVAVNAELEGTVSQVINRLSLKLGFTENKPVPRNAEETVDLGFDNVVDSVMEGMLENVRTYLVSTFIKKILYDMIFGLGPLEDLLRSPSITEIMVTNPKQIYIERGGRVVKVPQTFPSDEAAISIIERIVAPLGRRIDRSQPLVDARLRDGSRVNAIIEPLAIRGPCITIRKFPQFRVTVDDLLRWGSLTPAGIALLRGCVQLQSNVLISGGTGSGKTTLLNVLSGMIPNHERLVTVEDSAELKLQQEHVVSLETRPPNSEGAGAYTTRDLVRNALRMRPDRIIVGECRGAEAIDMLQAMNTGHRGSMTTIHANSAEDAITRLETMVLMGADIPLTAVRRQIASALHLLVHVERTNSGQRLVSQVSELIGLHPDRGEVETRDIMLAVPDDDGRLFLKPTGYMPSFLPEMVERGLLNLDQWFQQIHLRPEDVLPPPEQPKRKAFRVVGGRR